MKSLGELVGTLCTQHLIVSSLLPSCIAHLHFSCLTSLNFSSRINAGGAEGSPCRFYLKHAKSISTDRDTMQGALHISLAYKLLPLIFPLTVGSTEIARLSGAADGWQTDRRYPSKLAITEGGCRQREADSLINAIKAFTAPVSVCVSVYVNAAT